MLDGLDGASFMNNNKESCEGDRLNWRDELVGEGARDVVEDLGTVA